MDDTTSVPPARPLTVRVCSPDGRTINAYAALVGWKVDSDGDLQLFDRGEDGKERTVAFYAKGHFAYAELDRDAQE